MNLLGAIFIGTIIVITGLGWNMNWPFLTNQSHISQAVAAETLEINPSAEFTRKNLSKKPFRTLWNMFKSEPWRLSQHSR